MKKYKDQTLAKYLDALSSKTPVPGGGSAGALAGALGAGLISMVANYSIGKGKPKDVERKIKGSLKVSEKIKKRLLALVDLDAEAYLGVVNSKNAGTKLRNSALLKAREVPLEVCLLCYRAIELTPYLVAHGNKNLLSDVKVAAEILLAAYNSAMINVRINQ